MIQSLGGTTNVISCSNLKLISSSSIDILRKGGLVVFPTSTVYGLAGDAMRPDVVKKIFSVKNRSLTKPMSIIISNINQLSSVAKFISKRANSLMEKFWPGGVTFVLEACEIFPDVLTAGTGKIGVRIPLCKLALALVEAYGSPLTATSANLSGRKGAVCIDDVGKSILNSVDLVINAGFLGGGVGSTVVDLTVDPIQVIREGSVPRSEFIY